MDKKEILKKVKNIEQREAFVKRCLKVKICPECGGDLAISQDTAGNNDYNCHTCGFHYKTGGYV